MRTKVVYGPVVVTRHRTRRRIWTMGAAISGLLLVSYFTVAAIAVATLSKPPRHALGPDPMSYGVPFESITFPARGTPAVRLSGWFLAYAGSHRAIILVHGFGRGGCRTCGFHARFGELGVALQQRGFNVLLFDVRGHGHSSDGRYTFGLQEKDDVEGAVDWLLQHGFRPGMIGVLGESMGGAASILAAAEEPAVGALVTDSAFADLERVLRVEFPKQSGLPSWFLPGAYLMGRLIIGADLRTARPVDLIGHIAPRPVLLIHGTADEVVPLEHLHLLAQADPSADVWIVVGAPHVGAYANAPHVYLDRVARFLMQGLPDVNPADAGTSATTPRSSPE
jgi:fermentation-respiration switch protein FrsA (DUF1100 family)